MYSMGHKQNFVFAPEELILLYSFFHVRPLFHQHQAFFNQNWSCVNGILNVFFIFLHKLTKFFVPIPEQLWYHLYLIKFWLLVGQVQLLGLFSSLLRSKNSSVLFHLVVLPSFLPPQEFFLMVSCLEQHFLNFL